MFYLKGIYQQLQQLNRNIERLLPQIAVEEVVEDVKGTEVSYVDDTRQFIDEYLSMSKEKPLSDEDYEEIKDLLTLDGVPLTETTQTQ